MTRYYSKAFEKQRYVSWRREKIITPENLFITINAKIRYKHRVRYRDTE